jgi:acylglycerol lipase
VITVCTPSLVRARADHAGNAYGNFFPTLASQGIEVHSFDQRGWGRSAEKQSDWGLTGPTTTVLADISAFIRPLLPATVPLFLMGHSMGGAEVLVYIRDGPPDIKKHITGYLLESPFIAFHPETKPSPITVAVGRLVGKILPRRQMVFKLDEKLLSRDPAVCKAFVEDKLCHDTGTLEGLAGNLDRAIGLDTGKILVPKGAGKGGVTRLWLSHGTKDGVCDYKGTEKLYGRLDEGDDKALKLYDGWYHKSECARLTVNILTQAVHAEPSPDKETYAKDVADWIFARLDAGNTGSVRSLL